MRDFECFIVLKCSLCIPPSSTQVAFSTVHVEWEVGKPWISRRGAQEAVEENEVAHGDILGALGCKRKIYSLLWKYLSGSNGYTKWI